jgi:hypothetical protein
MPAIFAAYPWINGTTGTLSGFSWPINTAIILSGGVIGFVIFGPPCNDMFNVSG